MKLSTEKFYAFLIIIANFFLLVNSFKFQTNDDLIIKFNVENSKFKNPEYVMQVKKKLKKEMNFLKRKLISYPNISKKKRIPDDIDLDNNVKIYEEQKNSKGKNDNNNNDEDDSYISDFEEKDLIKSKNK